MADKVLVIDFETHDPYIDRGMGNGWVYGICSVDHDFTVLGAACLYEDNGEVVNEYILDFSEILDLVEAADVLVMHNSSYDYGAILYLEHELGRTTGLQNKIIYDTLVAGKLYNNTDDKFSLDYLSRKYLGAKKANSELEDAAESAGLLPDKFRGNKVLWCKKNMHIMQEYLFDIVEKYALMDSELTYKLYKFYISNNVTYEKFRDFFDISHVISQYRVRGVRVDIGQAKEVKYHLENEVIEAQKELDGFLGDSEGMFKHIFKKEIRARSLKDGAKYTGLVNAGSSKQLAWVMDSLGIKYTLTEKGSPSFKDDWLETQKHPIFKPIRTIRKNCKFLSSFIDKIIDTQKYSYPDAYNGTSRYGRVHSTFKLFGAVTGRFSCTEPPLQQIPSRDPVLAPMVKKIFVAEEGEKFYSLDYSQQEPRLQLHYAILLGCAGTEKVQARYKTNVKFSLYDFIIDMLGISKQYAKTLVLANLYGMSEATLCDMLGLPTAETGWGSRMAGAEGKRILREFSDAFPYFEELNARVQDTMKNSGRLITLNRRVCRKHSSYSKKYDKWMDNVRKSLNILIQGSAADQTVMAMVQAHRAGLPVALTVHDELCMSGTREQAEQLKEIMETCAPTRVPMYVGIGEGDNWAEAK